MTEDALSHFINYGMSVLKPGRPGTDSVYRRTVHAVTVSTCAQLCLNQTQFYCLSFDVIFTAAAAAADDDDDGNTSFV